MDCQLVCSSCGTRYASNIPVWRCKCGSYLDLEYMPVLDRSRLSGTATLTRYAQVLPLDNIHEAVTYGEGCTPMVNMEYCGISFLGKMDCLLPTGSFKDRGASVMINRCRELGLKEIVEDSSGNAAAAIAAYCARAGIKANIYMPAGNSSGKALQVKAYGATLHLIEGNRIDCANAAIDGATRSYYAAHAWNPYFLHGNKTVIYEVVEQLNWEAPDYFFLPVGSGSQILGAYLGLKEMKRAGIIDRMPRLMAVQSNKCAPLKDYTEGRETPVSANNPSIAEGIAIHRPVRLKQIVNAVLETEGDFVTVEDEQILRAMKEAALQGVFIEPTSAAAIAALEHYIGIINKNKKVVVSLTGNGLKAWNHFHLYNGHLST